MTVSKLCRSEFCSLRRMEGWVKPTGIRCAASGTCTDFKRSLVCRAVLSTAPTQPAALPEALALLSPFFVAVHRSIFLRMMNVVCMPRAPVLVQPQLGIFPFHHWKFSTRHQIQTFRGGGEEQLPQVTFLWITGLSLRFIDNCMILVVLVGKKVFVYIHIYIFKKRLNIQDEMLFLS